MISKVDYIIQNLRYDDLQSWYKKLNIKKTLKGLTKTQQTIYNKLEDRLWYEYRV